MRAVASFAGTWSGSPPRGDRVVVVAPHPDDEVLAAGGLMRWAVDDGRRVLIVAVTDGEASHQASQCISPDELRRRRDVERREALERLGIPDVEVVRLGLPDQGCRHVRGDLVAGLRLLVDRTDTIVGPSALDRHPDHLAVAGAVALVAGGVGAEWWEAPTWALWHGSAVVAERVLHLDDAVWVAKRHAMAAFRSQLETLGPSPLDGPVVHPVELDAMLRPVEQFDGGRRSPSNA